MIDAGARDRAAGFLAAFAEAGAVPVRPPILLDAGPLLDLYGEEVRARAFVTHDPLRGEAMLRPDLTVPVVMAHRGTGPARYAYAGEVFRLQEDAEARPREYPQAGIELLGGPDPAAADAEAFDLIARALAPWGCVPATGDLGLLLAAVDALDTTDGRRAALRRHVPRPGRFRRLMARYTGAAPRPAPDLETDAPLVGLRAATEVAEREAALAEDAAAPPLAAAQARAIAALLDMECAMAAAPLRALVADLPGLAPAVDAFEARRDALAARGHDPATLPFAPARGRGAMEYYDGFTFTFRAGSETVAMGGRYDALTAALLGRAIPAVGATIRPGLLGDAP